MKNEKKKRLFNISKSKEEQEAARERTKKDISERIRPVLENIEKQFTPLGTALNEAWARNDDLTSSALVSAARSLKEMHSHILNPISDSYIKLADINRKISATFLPTIESINIIKPIFESTQRIFETHAKQINMVTTSLDEIYKTRFIPERIIDLDDVIIVPPPPQVIHHHHHHFQSDPITLRRINGYIYLDNSTGRIMIMDLKSTVLHCFLPASLIWLLNALLDNSTHIITKSMAISEGQRWDTCMTKYHRINKACYCKLVQVGPEENSLRLDLKAIPEPLAKVGKFELGVRP